MNTRFRYVAVACMLMAVAARSYADRVDDYVKAQMQKQHIPGLSVAVVREGRVVKAKGYGLANVELRVPATPQTVYEIGSITKQFTATAVMMLVEEGKVGLEDPISKYLDDLPAAWKEVTVRHLLTHTSGIKSYTGVPDFIRLTVLPASKQEVIKTVASYPLEFKPGEKWSYSNTGYFLLGMLIEKVTGKPYGACLQERIFAPLGMASTRVNDLQDVVPNRAAGYGWTGTTWRNAEAISMTWPYAAGALVSTVTDLAKWDAALYTERLLKQASLTQMWTSAKLNGGASAGYGFGWSVDDYRGHRHINHGGGIPGFITFLSRFPDEKLTVIVLTNVGPCDPGRIAQGVAGLFVPGLRALDQMHAQSDPDPQRTSELKSHLDDLAGGKQPALATAGWSARMKQIPPPMRNEVATWLKEQTAFTYLGADDLSGHPIERFGEPIARLCFYRMEAGKRTIYWTFALTADGKVADARPDVE